MGRWPLARLLDALPVPPYRFPEADCGKEPHAGKAGWTHWSPPTFEANTRSAKELKSAGGKDSVLGIQLRTPRSAGVRIHTLTHGHTQRHAHTPTHAGPRVPVLTHTPSDAHTLLPSPPSSARHFLGLGGGGGPPLSVLKRAPLRLPAPTKLLFFVAVSSVRVFTSSQS